MSQKATDSEIEDVIKDWFRFAKDRERGRKRREQERRQRMALENVNDVLWNYYEIIFIISVYSNYLIPLFSSPDPKGKVSYCHHFASVVRLSVH